MISRKELPVWGFRLAVVLGLIWLIVWIISICTKDPFEPVEIVALEISPQEIDLDSTKMVTLQNGICSSWPDPLTVQVWLGIEPVVADPLFAGESIPLVGTSDSVPEEDEDGNLTGRRVITLQPGCTEEVNFDFDLEDPENAEAVALLNVLEGGTWQLVAHLVAVGPQNQIQNERETSQPFTVHE